MKQHAEFGVLVLRARDGKDGPTDFGTRFSNWGKLMQLLPRKGALAIAAVIDIAINARGRPVAAKSLATRHRLPPRHLEPVLQALVRHGILKGTRGPRGGYELAREQRRITADDILRDRQHGRRHQRNAARRFRAAQQGGDAGARASRARLRRRAGAHQRRGSGAFRSRAAQIGGRGVKSFYCQRFGSINSSTAVKGKIRPSTFCCIVCLSKVRLRWRQTRFSSAGMAEREEAEMKLVCAFFAALTALLGSHDGFAQSAYPDKAVRILVGFPPGGPPDIAARLLADKFAVAWGKPVLVENATGAGGNVAVERAAKATPDGYTLVMASSAITINPSLYEKLPYDPVKDLAPISLVVFTPSVLVVHSDVTAKNVHELVALARAQPGKLTYGHAGVGTPSHLSAELFKSAAGVNIQPVPYRGIPSLLPDLLAGRVTMTLPNMSVVLPLVREGKLRALMAMAPARPAALPDVPTLAEAGFTGFDTTIWFGLMAPAGTPQPIVDKLYAETARVLAQNDARKHLQDLGMEIVANTPSEFATIIKSEIPQWAKLIKDAGISVNE